MGNAISDLDLFIIGGYFIIVFGIGLWVARSTKTGSDLFLGGRTFTWGLIGLSLFASNISSSTIIGLSGAAYSDGIVGSVYEWMSGIPLIIAALIFVPLYLRSRITTIPEFLELRYDSRSRYFFSIVTIFTSIIVDTAGGLYAGAIVLQTFFPDLIIWQTCLVLALVAGIYTAFGGLKAVVYTDALQAIILIIGSAILTYILFEKLDFSWDKVVSSAPEGHFSTIRPSDDPYLPWQGLIMGVPFLGFWYWATNQYIVQRVLGARDIQHARWGVLLAGFLKIVPLFIMVFPGAMAISLYPNLQNSDMVFPTIVLNALPMGLVGLVLAGLISAIMSSVDSTLNSASTLIVIDLIKPNMPSITDKQITLYGRISTLVLMVIAAVWAPMIVNFGGLWAYLQQMFSIIVPPIIVLFLVGVFYKRGNGYGAFWTLILGTLMGILFFTAGQLEVWNLHYTINVGITVILSILIFIGFSNRRPKPSDEVIKKYTYQPSLLNYGNNSSGTLLDYRYLAVILLVVIGGVLIVLW